MKKSVLLLFVLIAIFSCKNKDAEQNTEETPQFTELQTKARTFFGELPAVAENKANPLTEAKIALGKALYFDPILSANNTQSCNTCHNLNTYGVDNMQFSAGDGEGTMGGRNSPTVLNAALHVAQFWDGRAADVEEQAGGPILNPVEMGMGGEKEVLDRVKKEPKYVDMFAAAYPDSTDKLTWKNLTNSIGAFERELITPGQFDKYLAGEDSALTDEQKKGLQLFIDKGCITCHIGNTLGGSMFQKFGIYGDYWNETKSPKHDEGKYEVTKNDADKYFFKVPSLRNVAKTYPYFHDGSVTDLKEAVRIMGKLQLNQGLTDEEVNDITAFLESLTGEVPEDLKNNDQK